MALLSRGREYPSTVMCYAYLGLIDHLTLFNFHVITFCSTETLHSVELECITSNLPDVAFKVFHRLKFYLFRLAFLTTNNFIFHTWTQIKFFFIVM
jgi:hypothetical protein